MNQRPAPQALPTQYRGVRFRSRNEARWAVFFDALGLRWHYEPEGYALPSGPYLPDFLLPELGSDGWFIEVKPEREATDRERALCSELAAATQRPVALVHGPPAQGAMSWGTASWEPGHASVFIPNVTANGGVGEDHPYQFCVCPRCRRVGLEFEARGARVCHSKCLPNDDRAHTPDAAELVVAYERARCWTAWA